MQPPPDSPKKTAFTGKNIVIGVIATIAFVVAAGYFMGALIFNGGINGLISNLKPEPNLNSSAMNAKREAATVEINQAFDELQNTLDYNYYETATHDYCSRGSNGYISSDGYAYRCSLRITKFYGFNGDFRQQMIDFEQKMIANGWESSIHRSDYPMEEMLEEHYDQYTTYQSGDLDVNRLPTYGVKYEKDGLSLEIDFAEKETDSFNFDQKVRGHSYHEIYDEKNFQDSSLVTKEITDTDRFVLLVSIQKKYFQN